jgi:hypothetical protein
LDIITHLLDQYGLAGAGWVLFAGFLALLGMGKLKTKSSVDDHVKELESRVADREQRLTDSREDINGWRNAFVTLQVAREADQQLLKDAIESAKVTADLMAKLHTALAQFDPHKSIEAGPTGALPVHRSEGAADVAS